MYTHDLLKNKQTKDCPAQRISYAAIADTLRFIFNTKLYIDRGHASRFEFNELEWLMSDKYGKSVDKAGGCSFEYCCLCLDFDPQILRDVVKLLLSDKSKYKKYISLLLNNLYSYNNIYYNIYNKL